MPRDYNTFKVWKHFFNPCGLYNDPYSLTSSTCSLCRTLFSPLLLNLYILNVNLLYNTTAYLLFAVFETKIMQHFFAIRLSLSLRVYFLLPHLLGLTAERQCYKNEVWIHSLTLRHWLFVISYIEFFFSRFAHLNLRQLTNKTEDFWESSRGCNIVLLEDVFYKIFLFYLSVVEDILNCLLIELNIWHRECTLL